jgi:phosphate transport system substrate-binding protein
VSRVLAAVSICLCLLAGCGGGGSTNGGSIIGAGSSFVFPLVAKWIPDYQKKRGVKITYGPIGSGGGILQLTNRTIDFGGSDAPLSADQTEACNDCLQIPWALGAISIPYNVPGAPKHLKLTGEVLADIFLGKVTSWNDASIAALNPDTKLPDVRITPIHRLDSSGSTYNLTDYLSKVSPDWRAKVGTATEVVWPTGPGARGSSGVAAAVKSATGGIAYVDTAYSTRNGFSYAALRNRAGTFALPDSAAVKAAAATAQGQSVSIVDPPPSATQAYPLSTFTFALVPRHTAKAALLKPFLTYAVTDGQRFVQPLEFAPLPPRIVELDKQTIARISG